MRGIADLLILCYHSVSASWPESWSVTPPDLETHVAQLLRRGYWPMTLSDALERPRGRRQMVITFDDAFASVVANAAPSLDRLEIPATVFLPVAMVGGRTLSLELDRWFGTPYESELTPMDWSQVVERQRAGWEVGSHTLSHAWLTKLGDKDLAHELEQSRTIIEERLGVCCRSLAYPFGSYDSRVVTAAANAGYHRAVTLNRGRQRRMRPLELPRIAVLREMSPRWVQLASHPAWRASEPVLWRLRGLGTQRRGTERAGARPI